MGDNMTAPRHVSTGDRIIDPMIALARCTKLHRIVVAGSNSIERTLELNQRGYLGAAATANCGRPAGQYDVALVDWRGRTFKSLEITLDRMAKLVRPAGVLIVWVDAQKPAADQSLRFMLERRGFVVEAGIVHECGHALSSRRRETRPFRQAA
jgi:hypothetical protein